MMKELKIMNRHVTVGLLTMCIICSSCVSMDMEEMPSEALESFEIEDTRKSKREEKQETESFVEEELKNQEIIVKEKVVYIERPVYVPESEAKNIEKLKGTEAVKNSERTSTVLPEQYNRGTFYYQYNENLVYEIYAQPYHLTDICLQTGEVVISHPFLYMERMFLFKLLASPRAYPIAFPRASPIASPSSLAFVIFWFRSSSFLSSSIFFSHSFSSCLI